MNAKMTCAIANGDFPKSCAWDRLDWRHRYVAEHKSRQVKATRRTIKRSERRSFRNELARGEF